MNPFSLLVVATTSSLLAAPALAQGISTSLPTAPAPDVLPVRVLGTHPLSPADGLGDCTVIDFEGIPNNDPIGTLVGPVDVTFGSSWRGLIDEDAGGTGNFANEPSPDTVAFATTVAEPIDFSVGVNFVEVSYVASAQSLPMTLTAFDGPGGTGNIVATAQANTNGQTGCTGDPTGTFCLWDVVALQTPGNDIRSITLTGAVANQFAFDNMRFCQSVLGTSACTSLPNSTTLAGQLIASGSEVALDNDLTLTAVNLPANELGYVLNSMNTGAFSVGSGTLCLGQGKGRHTAQIGDSGALGSIVTSIDLSALPRSSGGPATVMAGETWYFQLWHRDGMSSNFTDAVCITFQ